MPTTTTSRAFVVRRTHVLVRDEEAYGSTQSDASFQAGQYAHTILLFPLWFVNGTSGRRSGIEI